MPGGTIDQELAAVIGDPKHKLATQAGFIPIPLRYVPASALQGMPIYLKREGDEGGAESAEPFTLYRAADVRFTPEDRQRLLGSVRHVYIRIADHDQFRRQADSTIVDILRDPEKALAEKAALVYETSLGLINDLLEEPDVTAYGLRLKGVARGVATLVLSESKAFSHLFNASRHDFYTATHMVNVGTWIVALAYAMGHRDPDELVTICQAGLLHDLGKIFVPPEVLNKAERLTNEERTQIKQHALLGWKHIQGSDTLPVVVKDVCRQHHERLDGSGYPDHLKSEHIHPVSRMCAVVDSFDAMTALRPYKQKAMSVSEAILELRAGAPEKYDADVVAAWVRLLAGVEDRLLESAEQPDEKLAKLGIAERRRYKRFPCDCDARVQVLMSRPDGVQEPSPVMPARVRDVSRQGLGLTVQTLVKKGSHVRVLVSTGQGNKAAKRVEGRVMWSAAREDGAYDVGIELFAAGSDAAGPPGK